MKILFCSVPFSPSVGGIETVSALLVERFHQAGDEVVLVTQTPRREADTEPYRIVRRPSAAALLALVRWADVVFHNNISLRLAWPQLLVPRPWVVAHHTWIPPRGLASRVKRAVLRRARHIAVSRAIAQSLPQPAEIIPNPYADDRFFRQAGRARDHELIFVGRLVSDKGVDILIEALARLAERGRRVELTVVGEGPEAAALRAQAASRGVDGQIEFVGRRVGADLVDALNAHRVLVVPSVWEEPFGVVALEAIACGCVPIVARSGGLPDAVGPCGVVVPRADPGALAAAIDELLCDPVALQHCQASAAAHLERHTRDRVARDYLRVIHDAHRRHATPRAARLA